MPDSCTTTQLSKPRHFSCYDSEWAALEKERAALGLYTCFDVIRYHFRRRNMKGFTTPRKAKPATPPPTGR